MDLFNLGLPLFIPAAIASGLAYYAWKRRAVPGAILIFFLMLAVTVWSIGYAFELGGASLSVKLSWAKVQYLGIVCIPVLMFIYTLQYSGRETIVNRRNIILLFLVPLAILSLVWTNEWHHWIWKSAVLKSTEADPILKLEYGPGFWLHTLYSYLLLILGTLLLVNAVIRSKGVYRKQSLILLLGTLAPWIGNALYLSGANILNHLDLTPFAFTITGLFYSWGQFRFQLFDLVPVARDALIENMSDAVIVLDSYNRIVDINPAGQQLLGSKAQKVIGQPAAKVFASQANLVSIYQDTLQAHTEIFLGANEEKRPYDLRISPIYDRRSHLAARLIVLRDISDRWNAQKALQSARDELELRVAERTAQLQAANIQQELLLKEIHHRVKNNLQIISSLLNLQAGTVDDPKILEALCESQTRVHTMGMIHEKLYQSKDLASIDFDSYIQSLAGYLFTTYDAYKNGIALVLEVEKIHLGIDTAVPCGLIINELVSNALKYAFPDKKGGEIKIILNRLDDQQFRLCVADQGVGFPEDLDLAKTQSLGLHLVDSLVGQLDGLMEIHREGGTRFEITFASQ